MIRTFTLVLFLNLFFSFGQPSPVWENFSGEQKAFFFRIARTTDILNTEIFHLFEFTDSIPWINDTLPDWKFVEKEIIRDPSKLILHSDQLPRISDGIVSDLAVHFALWELDMVLQFRKSTDPKDAWLKEPLAEFEKYVAERVPASAIDRKVDGSYDLRYSLPTYFSPSLSCHDRMAALKNSGFVQLDQMLCANAIYDAMALYIWERSRRVAAQLGGLWDPKQEMILSAAGDGAAYSDLEDGYKPTPQNSALPENNGLFTFKIVEEEVKPKAVNQKPTGEKVLDVQDVVVREFRTNAEMSTVLHFDVYNWHKERQTTIAIQKGGNSYILYGNNENRLLSPDSAFGEGSTYRRLIWELENVHIADLKERLYGKRGYEYWIKEYEKKIQLTLLKIKKTEYKLDMLRHKPQPPPKIKKKKWRKIDLTGSDQAGQGHPTDGLTKTQKKINIEQNRLIFLEGQLAGEQQMLARLKKEMEEAYFILVAYENRLDRMQKNLGLLELEHERSGDYFLFNDGSMFNKRTQDFTFACNGDEEAFSVHHICFGDSVYAPGQEENFIHIQKSLEKGHSKYTFHKVMMDNQPTAMSLGDSIQIMEIFSALAIEETDVEIFPVGMGKLDGEEWLWFRDKNREEYNSTGATVFDVKFGKTLHISVHSWTEKIPDGFNTDYPKYASWNFKNFGLSELDYLSGSKALTDARRFIDRLEELAAKWLKDPEQRAMVLRKLSKIKLSTAHLLLDNLMIGTKVPVNPNTAPNSFF